MNEIYEKLKDALTSREIHRLFGDVTYKYEMMRFNGTPAMVKGIYGHDIKKNDDVPFIGNNQDPYIQEYDGKEWVAEGRCWHASYNDIDQIYFDFHHKYYLYLWLHV